ERFVRGIAMKPQRDAEHLNRVEHGEERVVEHRGPAGDRQVEGNREADPGTPMVTKATTRFARALFGLSCTIALASDSAWTAEVVVGRLYSTFMPHLCNLCRGVDLPDVVNEP